MVFSSIYALIGVAPQDTGNPPATLSTAKLAVSSGSLFKLPRLSAG
jgi:hypothetical protein